MTRAPAILLVAVVATVAGCGFAGVPGLGPGVDRPAPVDGALDVRPPTLVAPVISDEAMERAVQAGLARSDDDTWRTIERCLTPTRSQVEQMLESLQEMRRQPGGGASANPLEAMRSASLDPRLGRARVLTQQGLLDAAYVLLVDVLCEYSDAGSKSTVLMALVDNREEAGDLESAVWFVEGWRRADDATVASQEAIARQQQALLQSAQRRSLGSLMSGAQSAETTRLLQRQARDMRVRMLLPVVTAYARLGDLDRARQRLAETQALMAPSPGAGGPVEDSGHLYYMLAEAAARVGDMPAALRAYEAGERRRRDRTRPDLSGASLAFVLAELGQHAEARRLAEAALAEAPGWSTAPHARERSASVEERMEAELEGVSNRLVAAAAMETGHATLVEVAVARGDGEAALGHLAEYDRVHARRLAAQEATAAAMQRYSSTMSGFAPVLDSVSAQMRATAYKERAQRAWRYGRAHMLAGRPREAAARLFEAVTVVENLRGLIRAEDRVAFFGRHTSPYAALVESLLDLPRTDDIATLPAPHRGHAPAEVAFHYAEAARARLLSEQIARGFVGAAERDLPPDVRERERALQGLALAELRRGVPYDESAAYDEFQRFVESLRRTHPAYATLKYPVPVTARQVPLRDDEALVAYAVLEQRIAVWLLRKGEPLRVFTSSVRRDEVLATAEAFRRSVSVTAGGLPSFDAGAAEKLYRWLLAEPLAQLAAGTSVIVVPDGVLSTLPFEALGPRGPGHAPAFAGARYTFAYVPSATVLTFERTARRSRGAAASRPLLAVGDPVYEDLERLSPPASLDRRTLATRSAREQIRKRGLVVFAPLPATRTEVIRIAATLGVPQDSPDIRLGRAANEKDVKALDLGAYRYLHFATHGVLAGDVPYLNQPALVLSQTADLGGEDGFLTMSEVLTLPLRADMVVLSACQTALGREVTGEGVVGLTRAFLYAGSRATVVSLWPVDDASTAVFMGKFYEHVKSGLTPVRALARAKQDLRAEGAHAHPFYWAPFVFFGAD
jgi:CHAT domain-containing protein/tetratricopeptide (TPR) repeat protein